MNSIQFGKFIKNQRLILGITQSELGVRLGVSDKAISKWELGKSFPDILMMESLSRELNVSISELYECRLHENAIKRKRDTIIFIVIAAVFIGISIFLGIKLNSASKSVVRVVNLSAQIIDKDAKENTLLVKNTYQNTTRRFIIDLDDCEKEYNVNDFLYDEIVTITFTQKNEPKDLQTLTGVKEINRENK